MKRATFFNILIVLLALTVIGAGCRKKPYGVTPLHDRGGAGMMGSDNPNEMMFPDNGAGSGDLTESGIGTANPDFFEGRPADRSILEPYTVYFDFDSSVIKSSETAKIDAVASYLQSNPDNALLVEGHCDERGTEEYNRALGERRALALREHLATLGVNPGIVRTLSYGEDMPADPAHDEAAWAKNRRGEFVVLLPKQ